MKFLNNFFLEIHSDRFNKKLNGENIFISKYKILDFFFNNRIYIPLYLYYFAPKTISIQIKLRKFG